MHRDDAPWSTNSPIKRFRKSLDLFVVDILSQVGCENEMGDGRCSTEISADLSFSRVFIS